MLHAWIQSQFPSHLAGLQLAKLASLFLAMHKFFVSLWFVAFPKCFSFWGPVSLTFDLPFFVLQTLAWREFGWIDCCLTRVPRCPFIFPPWELLGWDIFPVPRLKHIWLSPDNIWLTSHPLRYLMIQQFHDHSQDSYLVQGCSFSTVLIILPTSFYWLHSPSHVILTDLTAAYVHSI